MEPKILLLGRNLQIMQILASELRCFHRDIVVANTKAMFLDIFLKQEIDFVVIGGGLSDQMREEMEDYMYSKKENIVVHLVERSEDANPYRMVDYVNEKALRWKIEKVLQSED